MHVTVLGNNRFSSTNTPIYRVRRCEILSSKTYDKRSLATRKTSTYIHINRAGSPTQALTDTSKYDTWAQCNIIKTYFD
jgi:hypothetical protein